MSGSSKIYGVILALIVIFFIGYPVVTKFQERNLDIKENIEDVQSDISELESQLSEMQDYIDDINENYVLIPVDSDIYDKLDESWYSVPEEVYYDVKNIWDPTYQSEVLDNLIQDSVFLNEDEDFIYFDEDDIFRLNDDERININYLFEINGRIAEKIEMLDNLTDQ